MGWKLTLGLSEDRDFQWPPVTPDKFSPTGPYQSALMQLDRLIKKPAAKLAFDKYWQRCIESGSTLPAATKDAALPRWLADIRWISVMESERARAWPKGPPDLHTLMRSKREISKVDAKRVKAALAELGRFDSKHPYLLRIAHQRALQDFLSDEKIRRVKRPNPNLKRGFSWRTISGPSIRDYELQYISRMSFSKLDKMIAAWDREVEFMFGRWPVDWTEFGALRFDDAISPKAAAKLNVVQLGLMARLSSRLRDFTAGYGIRIYSTGQSIPNHGKPCWDVVAEFVNCALAPAEPLTAASAGRVWNKLSAKHGIRTQGWPKPAKSEPQVQKT